MSEEAISVTVKYFAELRDITKRKEDVFALSKGATVKHLLQRLREAYGTSLASRIFSEDMQLKEDYSLLVNGENVETAFSETPLKHGDEIVIIPPIAGG